VRVRRLSVFALSVALGFGGLATVAGAPPAAAESGSLTTTFAGGNNFSGNTFDLEVKTADGLDFGSFDINLFPDQTQEVVLYTRPGTSVGFESSAEGWTKRGQATVTSAGLGNPTPVPIAFHLDAGTYGVAVFLTDPNGRVGYTDGQETFSNDALTVTTQKGLGSPVFEGGSLYNPRMWNGTLRYHSTLTTTVDGGPSGAIASDGAAFTYSGTGADLVGYECRLTPASGGSEEFSSCPSAGTSYTDLADGEYTFAVRSVDSEGNADPEPATRTFTVDTTAPDTLVDSGPTGTSGTNDVTFTYSGDPTADVDHFECDLTPVEPDGTADFSECDEIGATFTDLPDGTYTFAVRAVDALDHRDETPASRDFTVDTTGPETTVTTGPTGTTGSDDVAFTYSSSAADVDRFECDLSPAEPGGTVGFSDCLSYGTIYTDLPQGPYTFSVRALDGYGNADATPATRSFRVNTGTPTLTAVVTSAVRSTATGWYRSPVTITYTCADGGSALTTACPAPVTVTTDVAVSTVRRQIATADGDTAIALVTVSLDHTLPRLRVAGFTKGRTYTRRPSVACVGSDALSGLRSCRATTTVNRARTRITVRAQAVDVAGNVRVLTLTARYRGR
jgi:hypothetical protein